MTVVVDVDVGVDMYGYVCYPDCPCVCVYVATNATMYGDGDVDVNGYSEDVDGADDNAVDDDTAADVDEYEYGCVR